MAANQNTKCTVFCIGKGYAFEKKLKWILHSFNKNKRKRERKTILVYMLLNFNYSCATALDTKCLTSLEAALSTVKIPCA